MGMLDRYRKTGGFVQLVTLLETCGPIKQEKFLEIIRQEAPSWAAALKTKTIDIERVYSWNDETLAEIIGTLQDLCLGVAIFAADDVRKDRLLGMLTLGRKRKIDDLLLRAPPNSSEIATMHTKIVETVRKMAIDGYLRFEKFDPELLIEDAIEDKLDKRASVESSPSIFAIEYGEPSETEAPAPSSDNGSGDRVAEILSLKRKLLEVAKENSVLRHELNIARGKLDQIKKIA